MTTFLSTMVNTSMNTNLTIKPTFQSWGSFPVEACALFLVPVNGNIDNRYAHRGFMV